MNNKSQRFYQWKGQDAEKPFSTGVFWRKQFYRLEIERHRSRLFKAEEYRATNHTLHSQPHYHIALYTDGDGSWIDNKGMHKAPKHTLLLLPPYYPHMILACRPETYRAIILTFRYWNPNQFLNLPFKNLLELYIIETLPNVPISLTLSPTRSYQLEERMEKLLDETLAFTPFRELSVANAFNQVMTYLHQTLIQQANDASKCHTLQQLTQLKDQLDRFPENNQSMDDMALMTNMSKEHFIRTFKKQFGTTPGKYRQEKRLEKAISLLLNSDLPIKSIAEITGYETIFYFSRIFKKHFKLSPQQYRQQTNSD